MAKGLYMGKANIKNLEAREAAGEELTQDEKRKLSLMRANEKVRREKLKREKAEKAKQRPDGVFKFSK